MDTGQLAGINHLLDGLLVFNPVLEEHTRRARHRQQISVSSLNIVADGVLLVAGITVLGIVVLDKGDRITAIVRLPAQALIGTCTQVSPSVIVGRIADHVAEGEVKRGALHDAIHLGAIDPVLHRRLIAIPELAHRVLGVDIGIVHAGIGSAITLSHIITEARVTQVVEQQVQVGLDDGLHIGALVVQVTHAAPVLTCIVVVAQRLAVLVSPVQRSPAVIVLADVGREHFIGHPFIHLDGEGHPVVDGLAVVDHHIGDGADTLILKGVDHRAQLRLIAKGAVIVGEPVQVIIAHRCSATSVGTLGNPHELEKLGQLIGLGFEFCPAGIGKGIPVKALQHHAFIA